MASQEGRQQVHDPGRNCRHKAIPLVCLKGSLRATYVCREAWEAVAACEPCAELLPGAQEATAAGQRWQALAALLKSRST